MVIFKLAAIMKTLFKFFVPMAAAVIAFASCQQEQYNSKNTLQITVSAIPDEIKPDPVAEPASEDVKTYISENKIYWGTGEYMKIGVSDGTSTKWADSSDATADIWNGEYQNAYFTFSVSVDPADAYTYYGLYPASAAAPNSNTNPANYKVNLPSIQNASSSSYDPAAYILVAKPEGGKTLGNANWNAFFRRATALNKITLKNVPSGVSINKVKITAEGKKLAGGRHFDLTSGESLEVYGTDATIEVLYATALTGTNVDVWFTSWGTEIAEGEKLTIVAYTTNSKSYTKEITVPAGRTIKFQEGCLNTLGANLSGIDPEDVSSFAEGDYVILAKNGNTYYALKGEASGTRIASVNYTGSLSSYSGDASLIWTIAASGSSYTIKNGGNYVGWTSGNSADLVVEADYDATKCLMSIGDNGDGTYKIYVTADATRLLARNTSNAYFAFYAGTQYKDIVFVPATSLEAVETPTFSPAAGEVASGTEVTISCATSGATIHYTVDGTDPTSSSATYSSPIEITATTTIKAIAVKEGMADSEMASATYTVQGAGSDWELVSDFSTIDDGGEYIFVNVQNSTSYYMNTATCNQGAGTGCVALTILPTESGFVASDNMILVLSGSAAGFVASNKEGKQLKIGATNNGLAINADSGTSLTFYTDDYVSGYTLTGNDTNDATRYIGMNSTTNFRCYTSVNNNVKTGEYVWYHHIGTGSTVTWNIESIAITTPPTKTVYTEGESFDPTGMVVTGHFVDADDNTNTKDEAVTGYTISPDGALATTDTQVTITYQGETATQNITVNAAATPTYDFETVAELNALVTSTSASYNGYLTDAVVSFVPATNTAIVKDASGSVMIYKSSHGLLQGQTYTGEISVTAIKYNSLYSEITAWTGATFSGSQTAVAPESVSLADLIGHYDDYQNAYVQVTGLTVVSISSKNINVTDGTNNYVVYYNPSGTIPCEADDVITAVGTITKYGSTEEIKVWASSAITVTGSAPKAVTFTQPTGAAATAGCSIAVTVGGNPHTSGNTVASGAIVTLTATAGTDYEFSSWTVSGATVADASSATTTFTMGTSAVTVSASFTSTGGGSTDPYYVKVTDLSSLSAGDKVLIINTSSQGALPAFTGTSTVSPTSLSGKYDSTNDRFPTNDATVDACAVTLVEPTTAIQNKVVFKLKMSNNYFLVKTATSGTGFNPATSSTAVSGDWTLTMDSNGRVEVKHNLASATRGLVWRSGTTNKFAAYALSNVNNTEYYNVYFYKLTN